MEREDIDPRVPAGPPARVAATPSWLLGRANARAHRLLLEHLRDVGVRPYEYRLLVALEEAGDLSQADLGRAADVDRSDVVGALNHLERAGFVSRSPDPTHGRRKVVSLTTAGRARLPSLHGALQTAQETVLEALSEPERRQLLELLTRIGGSAGRGDRSGSLR